MTIRRLLMLAGCLATCAATAQACPDHSGATAAKLAPRAASSASLVAWKPRAWRPAAQPAAAGLRVSLDPETGLPGMPRPEDFESLAGSTAEDERPVAIHWRANGSGRATLDERWEDHAVVTLDASGKPRWTCVHGKSAADRFMKQPVVPSPRTSAPAPGTVWEEK